MWCWSCHNMAEKEGRLLFYPADFALAAVSINTHQVAHVKSQEYRNYIRVLSLSLLPLELDKQFYFLIDSVLTVLRWPWALPEKSCLCSSFQVLMAPLTSLRDWCHLSLYKLGDSKMALGTRLPDDNSCKTGACLATPFWLCLDSDYVELVFHCFCWVIFDKLFNLVKSRGPKLNLPGDRWRQNLGESEPRQVFHKKALFKKSNLLKRHY